MALFAGRDVVRWGIIGCGDVTEVKSGPAFQLCRGSVLVAVMRRDAAKAKDYAERHGVPRHYTDAAALINDPEVDAVYVATPPSTHESYALAVAAAGKPCYVEKPMARNAAECDRMIAAFYAARLPLFVAYYRRRQPRFVRAAELIASGAIGAVTGATWRFAAPRHLGRGGAATAAAAAAAAAAASAPAAVGWRLDAEVSGGGLFLDLGSHGLDALDFLLGPLEFVGGAAAALAAQPPLPATDAVEDSVALVLRASASGALVSVSANFACGGPRDDSLRISGTRGELALAVFDHDRLTLTQVPGVLGAAPNEPKEWVLPNGPHVAAGLVQAAVDALLGRGDCPSTGATAARTSRLMDRALEGLYGGREDGFWNRRRVVPAAAAAVPVL